MTQLPNAPKVMAMHDLCSYGRSSLNVVSPLLAAVNCYCAALPTALLSSHYGFGFSPSLLDLSQSLSETLAKWDEMDLKFDAFYSGYLASPSQADIAKQYIERFKPAFIYIDPVLGDNGKLYPAFNHDQVKAMRNLLKYAHATSPNVTEANALLGLPLDQEFPVAHAKDFLKNLSDLGPNIAIVTGVPQPAEGRITSYLYIRSENRFFKIHAKLQATPAKGLHGTGDSFAAIVVGLLLAGMPAQEAIDLAMNFLSKSIEGALQFDEEIALEYPLKDLILRAPVGNIEEF